jgi:hypothetical protein
MGFNKKYLPSLEEFKKILENNPDYIKYCWKADALIGPKETLDFIEEEYKKAYPPKDR